MMRPVKASSKINRATDHLRRMLLTMGCLASGFLFWQAMPPHWTLLRQADASLVRDANLSPSATKNIEDIRPGDIVLAQDEKTGAIRPKRVTRLFPNRKDHLRVLTIESTSGPPQIIRTTDEHPFWVVGKGRVQAGELAAGDKLTQTDHQTAIITSVVREEHPESIAVYNFEVEDDHTYFVSAHGARAPPVLVHNSCLASPDLPPIIFRAGGTNPANLTPRAVDNGMLSFRDSLSNPITPGQPGPPGGRPVFAPGDKFTAFDTSKLPPGSVVTDNVPPGHVSVQDASVEQLKQAVAGNGKFPKD